MSEGEVHVVMGTGPSTSRLPAIWRREVNRYEQ